MDEPKVMASESGEIEVIFSVSTAYKRSISAEDWPSFITGLDPDLDPFDLDAIHDFLREGGYKVDEFLEELVHGASYLGCDATELGDLQHVSAP